MRYNPLGKSGLHVSEIGFGGWGIGGQSEGATSYGPRDEQVSLRALKKSFDSGITFYDTAHIYGTGTSERLIGQAFRNNRTKVVIATKAGRNAYNAAGDYSAKNLRRSVETSLQTLRTDYLDILQLHDAPLNCLSSEEMLQALESLKSEGKIRAFGISARSPDDAVSAIRDFGFTIVQVNFNLLDQRILDNGLLSVVEQKQAGLIARTPLCFGFLSDLITADTVFDPSDHRNRWPTEQIERWIQGSQKMADALLSNTLQTKAQIALRFCLSYPAIATVIPGILTEREATENSGASDLGPLSQPELEFIRRIYKAGDFFI